MYNVLLHIKCILRDIFIEFNSQDHNISIAFNNKINKRLILNYSLFVS